MRMKTAGAALLMAAALGMAGCGDDDDSPARGATSSTTAGTGATTGTTTSGGAGAGAADLDAITRVITTYSKDPGAFCRLSTPGFVRRVWGSPAGCEKVRKETVDAYVSGRTEVTVDDIEVGGTRATADVEGTNFPTTLRAEGIDITVPEHEVDGAVQLRRTAAGWRIDGLDSDFMRESTSISLAAAVYATSAGGGETSDTAVTAAARCVADRLDALPEAEEKKLLYALLGGGERSRPDYERAGQFVIDCVGSAPDVN